MHCTLQNRKQTRMQTIICSVSNDPRNTAIIECVEAAGVYHSPQVVCKVVGAHRVSRPSGNVSNKSSSDDSCQGTALLLEDKRSLSTWTFKQSSIRFTIMPYWIARRRQECASSWAILPHIQLGLMSSFYCPRSSLVEAVVRGISSEVFHKMSFKISYWVHWTAELNYSQVTQILTYSIPMSLSCYAAIHRLFSTRWIAWRLQYRGLICIFPIQCKGLGDQQVPMPQLILLW